MSTTTAVVGNPQRNDGGSILNGGNNDGDNVASTPTLVENARTNTVNRGVNLQLEISDHFQRGSADEGTTHVWASGAPDGSTTVVSAIGGSSGIYHNNPPVSTNTEELYINKRLTTNFKVRTLFVTDSPTAVAPGSPGIIFRPTLSSVLGPNASGHIWGFTRQTNSGIGRFVKLVSVWNDVVTALGSGLVGQSAYNTSGGRPAVMLLEMEVLGSGVTFSVNNTVIVSGDCASEIVSGPGGFVGWRNFTGTSVGAVVHYNKFEIFTDTEGDQNTQRAVVGTDVSNDGQVVIGSQEKSVSSLLGTPKIIHDNNDIYTTQKEGEFDEPTTFPNQDTVQLDNFGDGVALTRANQSSYRANVGAKAPTEFTYDSKN